ncbi:S-layer homology domain-containing protein [Paenibacillus athensensis]|nr:S-layer homology domain-containing protein [Paenibacillus athensensis]MCD1261264.1 S-layer homology domain-containing protein [Paenibacillus athensensis]
MRRATLIVLSALMAASIVGADNKGSVVEAKALFSDVHGHWAELSIEKAVQKGYVDGYPDGSFKPDADVTRAEFLKLVDTALQVPVSGVQADDAWYEPYIQAAVDAGFHEWSDFTSGDWDTPITRKEMARIAVRAATGDPNRDERKWMYLATKAGLINGLDDTGTLGEEETTTRAQSVSIIERILSIKNGQALPIEKHAVSRAEVAWHGTNVYTMLPRYFNPKYQDRFDIQKAQWDSSDGNYHEQLESYIVVDLDDPKDPFQSEIEGISFTYETYENGRKGGRVDAAPKHAFAAYSKVKQVIKGQYPLSLIVNFGGSVTMSQIVPQDAVNNKRSDWMSYYASQESTDRIYYSKASTLSMLSQWHIDKGLNPYYAKDFPSDGGTFYWISAQAIPKGDYYSFDDTYTALRYTPNLSYMNSYGPKKSIVLEEAITDYTVSNP